VLLRSSNMFRSCGCAGLGRSWQENHYSRRRAGERYRLTDLITYHDRAASRHPQEPEPPGHFVAVSNVITSVVVLWLVSLFCATLRILNASTSASCLGRAPPTARDSYIIRLADKRHSLQLGLHYSSDIRWSLTRSVPTKRNKNSTGSTSSLHPPVSGN
jgi:hypothetical protein